MIVMMILMLDSFNQIFDQYKQKISVELSGLKPTKR